MNPEVSIIVLTYNQEATVGRALDSLLAQDCPFSYEIVVSDDCSSDGTAAVCRRYATQFPDKVKLTVNSRNKGVQANYFDTLDRCNGRYIADCAGDDYWCHPHKLAMQVEAMENDPTLTLVHTAWRETDVNTGFSITVRPFGDAPLTHPGREVAAALITPPAGSRRLPVHSCTMLCRGDTLRDLYRAHTDLFRNPIYGCEDMQLLVLLATAGNVRYLPDVTLDYSVGGDTVSSTSRLDRAFDFALSTLRLRHELSAITGLRPKGLGELSAKRLQYLLALAFEMHDAERRDAALQLARIHNIRLTPKTRILHALTAGDAIWRAMRALRHLIKV